MVQNIENAFKKLFCEYDILKEDYQKSSDTLLFFQTQSLVMGIIMKNKWGLELVTRPFWS